MKNKEYLALLHCIWIGQRKLSKIFENKDNYQEIYENISERNLLSYWCNNKQIVFIMNRYKNIQIQEIIKLLQTLDVKLITINDAMYPSHLKNISNPPYLLYVRWIIEESPKIAVVGSRAISSYGKKCITQVVPDLGKYFQIVSWWALWCDTEAHKVCLEHWIKTLSVIGTWIDKCYPSGNADLYNKIVEKGGAVISIFPIWENGNKQNFPVRNEIVAALAEWTLVVEAKLRSGTLITAQLTIDMWKEVFAFPADIFKSNSAGCNALISRSSAKLVTSSEDILLEYNIWKNLSKKHETTQLVPDFGDQSIEKKLYNLLVLDSLSIDEMVQSLWWTSSQVSLWISKLELQGYIRQWSWWKYELN